MMMSSAPGPVPPPPPPKHPTDQSAGVPTAKTQEDAVVNLTELLAQDNTATSTNSGAAATPDLNQPKQIKRLFGQDVPNTDVVLVLPSLEIQLSDKSTALPNVGETAANCFPAAPTAQNNNPIANVLNQQQPRPSMAASVLTSATKDAADAEHEVAKSLSETTSWTKSTVAYAPAALVQNMSESFSRLVDSRMKAWTLLLLRHSLSTGDESSRKRLLGMLSASLKVESVSTQFRTLPMPESAKQHARESEVVLPLLFQATVMVSGRRQKQQQQGQDEEKQSAAVDDPVILRAPGTISAEFLRTQNGTALRHAKIQLDCNSLLSSMVEQARILVLQAVAAATKTQLPTATPPPANVGTVASKPQQDPDPSSVDPGSPALPPTPLISSSKSLASFRSALSLAPSSTEKSPSLLKAKSSALRLNSILQGKNDESPSNRSNLGLRKNRSVRWNTPGELPLLSHQQKTQSEAVHSPKKARSTHAAAKLKSFKSFGRPHAGDFGSGPRNATFGEFGGYRSGGMWGRDGRMAAHPAPQRDATIRDPISGEFQGSDKNATFNLAAAQQHQQQSRSNRPSIHLASGGGNGARSAMPRTATVLESLLLSKSMNGKQGY